MHIRTRYRIHTTPFVIVLVCALTLIAVVTMHRVSSFLSEQMDMLPLITMVIASLGPVLFLTWYLTCFAEVRRTQLTVRWFWRVQRADLRRLEHVEVLPAGRKKLVMLLEDARGAQVWLPLSAWSDEDLLMARVLRATVDCRLRIDGDPLIVQRFSGVLDSYKSWDRQLAA